MTTSTNNLNLTNTEAASLINTLCMTCKPFGSTESGKYFINEVYTATRWNISLDEFKALLLDLRNEGLVSLLNLEFRQGTPLATIQASRTRDQWGYEFHLIQI